MNHPPTLTVAVIVLLFILLATVPGRAQAPTGAIAGRIVDRTGAAIANAHIVVANRTTGATREVKASASGYYGAAALSTGVYNVTADAPGFGQLRREATVETGLTTAVDLEMDVYSATKTLTVSAATPQLLLESHAITGVVLRNEIERLPLNGRNFLELAKLEPGVQPPTRTNRNRSLVSMLGAPGSNVGGTRFTVDGGDISSADFGGSQINLSQEVVEEFQISTVNFDLSAGIADAGVVNVVTRSGDNELHAAAFDYFRSHKLSAYPGLIRSTSDPDPFFQRQQYGFALGGPLRRDRIFFFGNWERTDQRGVIDTNLVVPDFAPFSRITPTPTFGTLLSVRLDVRLSNAHTSFVRYSHDGNRTVGPITFASNQIGPTNGYPSTWSRQSAWADQSLLGLTSVMRTNLVNDLRFSYFFVSTSDLPVGATDCQGCVGLGAPGIGIAQAGLYLGNSGFDLYLSRRFHLNDAITWQHGAHRVRFGIDWEHNRGGLLNWLNEPATINLFSPDQVRIYDAHAAPNRLIPLPTVFRTLDDILQLPLQSFTIGIGDPRVPQQGGGTVRDWNTFWLYIQDSWHLHPRLTLNYGLGWSVDHNLNYDLNKPVLLAPLLRTVGLGPPRKPWKDFSPSLGIAWTPTANGKTVVRAGAGLFYGSRGLFSLDAERAALGRPGLGRQNFPGSSVANPLPGIPGVPLETPLVFNGSPTMFSGTDLMAILAEVRASKAQSLASADSTVQTIQVTKTFTGSSNGLVPADFPNSSALHASVGVQREIAHDFVLSADFAYRHFVHTFREGAIPIDLNHFNSVRGPVIPACSATQSTDPHALCSLGSINVLEASGRITYKGLLFRADKRFSHGVQVLGSYAYSSSTGTNSRNGFNLDNWLQNSGPFDFDFTHIVNLASVVQLPWHSELGLNFSYACAPPFSAFVGGIDFNGDGTTDDLLPGTTVNAFNRGLGRSDLERLVAQFNQTYAGTKDPHSRLIPLLTLPARYALGDNFHSLDLRLSRTFLLHEHWRLRFIGEVFNLYNKANLSDYSGDLTSSAFGQPTSRITQVFGSGGPRSFQLAVHIDR